ncbi:MAG: hypothetical protein ABI867_06820 [Kofleriaceae bacterium]
MLVPLALTACHAGSPTLPRPTDAACAVALPLLAKQHTPNATRIYLAPLTVAAGQLTIGTPVLATAKRGFVNQPAFAPDGTGLYFTWRPEGSQADIWFHDLRTGAERAITCSSEEEYAAVPGRDGLTVVRVERDLRRDLVRIGLDGRERQALFPALTNVGAQSWIDDSTVAVFVAGTQDGASSLVIGDVRSGQVEPIAQNVGAAIAVIPGSRSISYFDQHDDAVTTLVRYDLETKTSTPVLTVAEGIEQVAWLDTEVLAGVGTRIVRASPSSPEWRDVIDLQGAIEGALVRLVISADHRWLALVVRVTP